MTTPHSGRLWVLLAGGQFLLSIGLLLIASTVRERPPLWGGILDVSLVLTLTVTAAILHKRTQGRMTEQARQASYGIATILPAVVFLLVWVFRDQLIFNVLLPGLAWRTFLFLTMLPAALSVWNRSGGTTERSQSLPSDKADAA